MNLPLASDFTGPLYVVIGVGAAVALVGLFMVIAIFMGWGGGRRRTGRAVPADEGGPWKIVEKVLDWIFKSVPKAYRFAVALIMLGALIMIIPLAIGLSASAGGDGTNPTGPTTTSETTTGG